MNEQPKIEMWAVVELMGHQKIAGWCTETPVAGTNMLRVDVPETEKHPAFTRFLGGSAIYAINPVDEATAKMVAERIKVSPITAYDAMAVLKKLYPEVNTMIEEKSRADRFHMLDDEEDESHFSPED